MTRTIRVLAIVCLALGMAGMRVVSAHAATNQTLYVSSCGNDATAPGTLPYEVAQANNDTGDTIEFQQDCSGTSAIVPSSTLTITSSMTIDGSGQNVEIDGNNADQLVSVSAGASLALSQLTLQHGQVQVQGSGGAIYSAGTLSITNSTLSGNTAAGDAYCTNGGTGGALVNDQGTLSITNSTFSGNTALADDCGDPGTSGAIYNTGTATITNSTFSNNSAQGGTGGAIYNTGTATITNSTFSGNSAPSGSDGAIYNTGTATIANSTFSGNSATSGGSGGAIGNDGTLSITNSTLSGNSATVQGGAIDTGGTVSITNSTLSGNSASTFGGAIDTGGTATITNSTLSGNSASFGGAIDTGGTVSITNSTLSGNSTPFGSGGAIYNTGTATITSSTLAGNSGGGRGGAIENFRKVSVGASIIAGNSARAGSNCENNPFGYPTPTSTDQGYNLEGGTDCGFTGTGSLQNTNPQLSSLADNGGPTQTMALQQGSPAIDYIPAGTSVTANGTTYTLCPSSGATTDQRAFAQPDNGESTCDIGAYESAYPETTAPAIAQQPQSQTITAGQSATLTVTVTGNPAPSYQWYSSPTGASGTFSVITGATSASYPTGTLTTAGTTSYYLHVSNSAGSVDSNTVTVTVNPGSATAFSVTAPTSATVGGAVSVTVTAKDAYGNTATGYSGTVHFISNDSQASLPADSTLTNGAGTFSVTLNTAGTQTVTATDTATSSIAGTSGTITVAQASTTTSLVSSANPSILKQSVIFTATVAAVAPGGGTPGGTVTFKDGTTILGTGTLNGSGIATFTTTALPAGTHSMTASYAGNASFKASTSSAVSQQVRYTVKVLSTSGLTIVLQILDANNANVSASSLTVTAECVVAYSTTAPTTCGTTPVQTITKAFGFVSTYKGLGAAYSYSVNPHGLTKGQQYDLLVQADGDPIWHAIPFTD